MIYLGDISLSMLVSALGSNKQMPTENQPLHLSKNAKKQLEALDDFFFWRAYLAAIASSLNIRLVADARCSFVSIRIRSCQC